MGITMQMKRRVMRRKLVNANARCWNRIMRPHSQLGQAHWRDCRNVATWSKILSTPLFLRGKGKPIKIDYAQAEMRLAAHHMNHQLDTSPYRQTTLTGRTRCDRSNLP